MTNKKYIRDIEGDKDAGKLALIRNIRTSEPCVFYLESAFLKYMKNESALVNPPGIEILEDSICMILGGGFVDSRPDLIHHWSDGYREKYIRIMLNDKIGFVGRGAIGKVFESK